ncbi:MAG: dihydrofolate reductase [Tissierellia bacterium]|nr:dihydrofolate reductase [Tissierellia bacterium]
MNCIVNVDKNFSIGYEGDLQVRLSPDLKRFKDFTVGNIIIYGRNTLATFPKERPLPKRKNIILTTRKDLEESNDVHVCHSLEELFDLKERLIEEGYSEDQFFVCGGESVYRQLLPYVKKIYITQMEVELPSDSYFPSLGDEWKITYESDMQESDGIKYRYVNYEREE